MGVEANQTPIIFATDMSATHILNDNKTVSFPFSSLDLL